jgi:aspartate aminotransferase
MVEIMIWNPVKSDKRRERKMISEKMKPYVKNNSAIRMMFEEGNRLRAKYGADKVFDFSLGNPSVPAPDSVRETIIELVNTTDPTVLHGYMSNAGFEDVRQTIAESLNRRFDTKFSAKNLIMTVGAASGLNVILKTILNPGEEVIVFAPYFLEYGAYVRNYDGVLVEISPDTTTFQPNLAEFEQKITPKTKAVIVNTPHNPTGVVYSEETIRKLSAILEAKQKEFGTVIYLISDEPYRELAYDGVEVPYLTKYYDNTVVGYSYSKSLSLPGERIGYLVIPDEADGSEELISAATIANRTLGCVNAPSLIQKVVAKCVDVDAKTDLAAYDKNRQALYNGLKECGFECIKPQGAFYLFVKSPVADEKAFCEAGKKYNILMVPGSSFACPGYVRLAYCVSYDTIVNSLPEFKKLAAEYGLK